MMTLVIRVFIDEKQISERVIDMSRSDGYAFHDALIGIEVSKNALMPTNLVIHMEWKEI